jgi:GTP-binding protein HflX
VDALRTSKGELEWSGETEIETDRRIVRDRISLLRDKIKAIDKQKHNAVIGDGSVALGGTHVGKSTLMNAIGKVMFCRKQAFRHFDTTVRKVVIKTCLSAF